MKSNNERFVVGEERWHSFGAHRMRYLRVLPKAKEASAPPLILVHGFLASSFSWRHNLEILARDRVVYAIDLLGAGYSDRPNSNVAMSFSMMASGERLLHWLESTNLRNVDLLGTSHGGAVAMASAILDRQRQSGLVGRLVLVAPANPYMSTGRRRIKFFNTTVGNWVTKLIVSNFGLFGRTELRRMYFDPSKVTAETCAGYTAAITIKGTSDYVLEVLGNWRADMTWIRQHITSIKDVPALLLWGANDKVVPVRSAELLNTELPKSKLVVLAEAGHLPYEETPKEFNRAVLDYLNEADVSRSKDHADRG